MRIRRICAGMTAVLASTVFGITSFAAGWQQNANGYWYGTNADNSTWYSNGWQWIDGNGDGVAECYYFDGNGYMLANTTTPDGYQVNADGAWVQNGQAQTKSVSGQSVGASSITTQNANIPDFTGGWDNGNGKYTYEIKKLSDGTYKMSSSESRSAAEYAEGEYTGQYDTKTKILTFTGVVKVETFDENDYEPIVSYENDVMRFKMGDSGMLQIMYSNTWEDWLERIK